MRRLSLLGLLVSAVALAAPAAARADLVHFTTPSGNIDCVADFQRPAVDCIVERAAWPRVPPKPADCDLDWVGTEVALGRGRVTVGACRGDIGPRCVAESGDCPRLPYGRSLTLPSRVRCTSRRVGLICRAHRGGGPGFLVSRRGYRTFR
jgi:Family of unknown function (DUF6636)